MYLVFVRHWPKATIDGVLDHDLGLADTAGPAAMLLNAALRRSGILPRFIVSSRHRHALETAELLRVKKTRAVIPVTALTPYTPEEDFSFATIVNEAWTLGVDLLEQCDVLMLVGHETRLSQLANRFLRRPQMSQLAPLEALVVKVEITEHSRLSC
jgi:phosphohistidine phosphatase SixA